MSSSPIASLAAIALGVAVAAAPPLVLAQTHVSDIEVREPMPLQPGHEMKSATVKFGDLNINAASGADALVKRLKKAANNHPSLFPEDPVEQLRNNVWIAPYYEDDLPELASVIGVDKILFGSDWPHGEGLENPVSFTEELVGFSDADIRKVMRDNALDLLDVKVGSGA